MVKSGLIAALGLGLMLSMADEARASCGTGDFQVRNFVANVDNCRGPRCPRLILSGELYNGCAIPAGAEVEIEAKDARGRVVSSVRGWPATTGNVSPGDVQEFNFGPLMRYNSSMVEFGVFIVDVREW